MAFSPMALLKTFKVIFFVRSLGLIRTHATVLRHGVRPQKSLLPGETYPDFPDLGLFNSRSILCSKNGGFLTNSDVKTRQIRAREIWQERFE
jgi:hypothetical protein